MFASLQTLTKHKNVKTAIENLKQKTIKLDVNVQRLSRKRGVPKKKKKKKEGFFGRKVAPEYTNEAIFHYHRICFGSLDFMFNPTEDQFNQEDFRAYIKFKNCQR